MPMQDQGIDFIAYDDVGRVILLGEVKSRVGTSGEWAARFRRNMLAHGILPSALFFLIATPERMYFWKQDHPGLTEEPPGFTVDATKEFRPYLEKLNQTRQAVGERALELMVFSWLKDIARTGSERVKHDPSMKWLAESGLIDSLGSARIEMNPA
ncbi:MAG TPA: hypothetical protein VMG40_08455 [Bryobacteraceae bacterium]|nr:hypothetical protein [Bryobacteraceae bacterium]